MSVYPDDELDALSYSRRDAQRDEAAQLEDHAAQLDDGLARKLAGLSALANNVTTELDPVGRLLAGQIDASDPGVFTPQQVAGVVRATIALCVVAGVDPASDGPHIVETVLGRREFGNGGGQR